MPKGFGFGMKLGKMVMKPAVEKSKKREKEERKQQHMNGGQDNATDKRK